MKKFISVTLLIILIIATCALGACADESLTIYVPDGAPALSIAAIMRSKTLGKYNVTSVVTTGEEVVAKCASGEADVAVLPTNAAVKICSTRDDYQIFSVNVYGVLYVVGTERIDTLCRLKGQTLYSIGLGNTPEYVFKTICDKQGISYDGGDGISIKYETDASTIIPQVLQGKAKFALIGEPAVTQLQNKAASQGKTVYNLFDLQQLWQEATGSDEVGYPQACMIVKKSLLTNDFAEQLTNCLSANKRYAMENPDQLKSVLMGCGSTLDIDYTADLIGRCNLAFISAAEAKADIERYLGAFQGMAKFLPIGDGVIYEASK